MYQDQSLYDGPGPNAQVSQRRGRGKGRGRSIRSSIGNFDNYAEPSGFELMKPGQSGNNATHRRNSSLPMAEQEGKNQIPSQLPHWSFGSLQEHEKLWIMQERLQQRRLKRQALAKQTGHKNTQRRGSTMAARKSDVEVPIVNAKNASKPPPPSEEENPFEKKDLLMMDQIDEEIGRQPNCSPKNLYQDHDQEGHDGENPGYEVSFEEQPVGTGVEVGPEHVKIDLKHCTACNKSFSMPTFAKLCEAANNNGEPKCLEIYNKKRRQYNSTAVRIKSNDLLSPQEQEAVMKAAKEAAKELKKKSKGESSNKDSGKWKEESNKFREMIREIKQAEEEAKNKNNSKSMGNNGKRSKR